MYTNSYIFGSSRGRSMSQVKCKQVNILPGGTYSKLCDLAEKQLRNNTDPKIVYFIAGIPDICTLTRDKKQNYEESLSQFRERSCFTCTKHYIRC
jgi:hypothetical protein